MVKGAAHTGFWWRPQQNWLRRATFQIHLWAGIALALYCVVIGVSGSALVFVDELGRWSYPHLMQADSNDRKQAAAKPLEELADVVRSAVPGWELNTLYLPGVRGDNFSAVVSRAGKYRYVFVSSQSGQLLGTLSLEEGWLNWIADLHFRLLAGETGLVVNGIGATGLVLLCATGIIVWWPGVRTWKRALLVDFHRRWTRINFDLHSAIGFWTLALMSMWAVSGIYFVWPGKFVSAVSVFSKAGNSAPPPLKAPPPVGNSLPLQNLVKIAQRSAPGTALQGISFAVPAQPFTVMLTSRNRSDFSHTVYIYLDPRTGAKLGEWNVARNRTAGDWFVWLLAPLHFGFYWGLAVKILWAFLGLLLPVLSVTGVLMYWNRYLSKKWRKLKARDHTPGSNVTVEEPLT